MQFPTEGDTSSEFLFKVLVVGPPNAGKTCIIRQYVHKLFQPNIKSTIGVDFALKVIERKNKSITLQIWDIAGQERCGTMTRVYYQQAVGALVVYDSSDPESFNAVEQWKADIDSKVLGPDGRPIPVILVANKSDKPENPPRSDQWLTDYAKQHDFVGWIRTSALKNTNIDHAFDMLIDAVRPPIPAHVRSSSTTPVPRSPPSRLWVTVLGSL